LKMLKLTGHKAKGRDRGGLVGAVSRFRGL
jgi:hypothetical protein